MRFVIKRYVLNVVDDLVNNEIERPESSEDVKCFTRRTTHELT